MPLPKSFLDEFYDEYPRIEEEFLATLDESLDPRGPEMLYEIVASLRLPPGTPVLDLGCGEGKQSLELAKRFGFSVQGIDPVPRHIELARAAAESLGDGSFAVSLGVAEEIPLSDDSVDFIWCRDVLCLSPHLPVAFQECTRVLRPGGAMLVYQAFGTDWLEPNERSWLWETMGVVPDSADVAHFEATFTSAGFRTEQAIDLAGEWNEYAEEATGRSSRRLLHAARLLRDPERYIAKHGQAAYDIMLGDAFWHVYLMIGKLAARVYLLRARVGA